MVKLSRKLERRFMVAAGVWQILNGLLTIFIYAPTERRAGLDLIDDTTTFIEAEAIASVFSNIYMFIVIFGMIYITIGIINVILSKKMKDDTTLYRIPIYLLFLGASAYFVMDLISVLLCILAGGLALAKNKAIMASNM